MTILAAFHPEIRVNFRYGVYFTQDVFARHNPLLSEIVAGGGGDLPRKILVVVDRGLYRHHPDLLGKSPITWGIIRTRCNSPGPRCWCRGARG